MKMAAMAARAVSAVLLALCGRVAVASRGRAHITPVQQVLQALGEMKSKALSMEAEQKTFAQYREWVSDRTRDLGFEVQTGDTSIEQLTAFIEKADNKASTLGKEVAGLEADIARLESEKKDATSVRSKEHAEYVKLQQDYSESVDALERAIQVLSSQAYDRPQAEALLQTMAKSTPGMTRVLAAFLQEKARASGAPAVAGYEYQSDGIVKMLEGLLQKFKAELSDVEEDESNRAHYYDLESLHLSDSIAKASSDRDAKAGAKGETVAASAKARGDLADTKREKSSDEAMAAEIKATFEAKSRAFAENQKIRKDELEALSKATEVISSPEVASSYKEHISLAQTADRQMGFLQLRSSKRRMDARSRAVQLLRRRARSLSSRELASLAALAAENPFAKVVTLIRDLLARLKDEASAEADHKAWCDGELKKNKLKREKRATAVDGLTAKIQSLSADIDTMGKTIDTLLQEQADLGKAMSEATEQRQKEKATNADTLADAQAGTAAIKKALEILQEFYDSQQGASFLQGRGRQVPELEAYKGQQGSKKGVVGMLEVIQTDFLRLESETKAAEGEAAREYDSFMASAKADQDQKHKREVKLRLDKDQAEFDKSQLEKDLAGNADELKKANEYYEYLKPNCVQIHVSYEERAARRKEEIAALKEAYGILDSKSSP